MRPKTGKRIWGILLTACMILTSVQLPGSVQNVKAAGEESQNVLQTSFPMGGLVQIYREGFEGYETGTEISSSSTLQGDGSAFLYGAGTTTTAQVVDDGTNKVIQLEMDGNGI